MKPAAAAASLGALLLLTGWRTGAPHEAPSFARDVLPLLQKQGCSSAYCHGGATGKGGFKLSLFGGDPDADWRALAVELEGRRVDLRDPDQSLVLQKPSRSMPHKGGERLPRDSEAYAAVRSWIAAGAPRGAPAGVRSLVLQRDGVHLRALATFTDGTERDVTARAVFSSTDPRVASVDEIGTVTLLAPGEAFLGARYAGADAVLRVVQPLAVLPAAAESAHPLDRAHGKHLRELGLERAPATAPAVLGRRLWLDLACRTPTTAELEAFLAAPPTTAVADAAATLCRTTDFTTTFTGHLARWLEVKAERNAKAGQEAQVRNLRGLLQRAVHDNVTLDKLAADVLQPGHQMLERYGDPRDRADHVARVYLGIRLGCARCHDHPLDRWRQQDHLGFASLLATKGSADGSMMAGNCYDDEGRPVAPSLLPLPQAPPAELDAFGKVRWLALQGTDKFARTMSNHLLGVLLDRAPVVPEDDHRPGNPPHFGGLLDATVAEYKRTSGDLRELIRFVVTSAAYAASSEPEVNAPERDALAAAHLARRTARALEPEVWQRAVNTVLDTRVTASAPAASDLAERLAAENGAFLQSAITAQGGFLATAGTGESFLRALFLRALSRLPRPEELAALRSAAPVEAAQAVLLSREFGSQR